MKTNTIWGSHRRAFSIRIRLNHFCSSLSLSLYHSLEQGRRRGYTPKLTEIVEVFDEIRSCPN